MASTSGNKPLTSPRTLIEYATQDAPETWTTSGEETALIKFHYDVILSQKVAKCDDKVTVTIPPASYSLKASEYDAVKVRLLLDIRETTNVKVQKTGSDVQVSRLPLAHIFSGLPLVRLRLTFSLEDLQPKGLTWAQAQARLNVLMTGILSSDSREKVMLKEM